MDKNVHIRKILMVEDIVIISNRTYAVCQENDFLGPKQANTKCIILYVNFPGKRNSIEKYYKDIILMQQRNYKWDGLYNIRYH